MLRKLLCAVTVLTFSVGIVAAEEVDAILTGVLNNGKSIKYSPVKLNAKGDVEARFKVAVTTTVTDDAKVVTGKFNETDKKWEAGNAIPGGLNAEMFKNLSTKSAVQVHLTVEVFGKNRKVTQVMVRTPAGK